MKLLIFIIAIIVSKVTYSQKNDKEVISYSEFIEMIDTSSQEEISITGYIIEYNREIDDFVKIDTIIQPSKDTTYVFDISFNPMDLRDRELSISNCEFSRPPAFKEWRFGLVKFSNCKVDGDLIFEYCEFNSLAIHFSELGSFTVADSKIFLDGLEYTIQDGVSLFHTEIDYSCKFEENSFVLGDHFESSYSSRYDKEKDRLNGIVGFVSYPIISLRKVNVPLFSFNDNETPKFSRLRDTLCLLSFIESNFDDLKIKNSSIRSIDLSHLTVKKSLVFDNAFVEDFVAMNELDFNANMFNIDWSQINQSSICIKEGRTSYFGRTTKELKNTIHFNNLVSTYSRLVSVYKVRGDMVSANACYVEMKDFETSRLAIIYREEKNLSNWFNWRFNQFFKLFCDYGTSPVKALKISLYTILCFAFIYFFFYSDWDRINRKFLISQHKKIMLYFKSNQNLEEEYSKRNENEVDSYEKYKKKIVNKTKSVPAYIRVLGRPLYFSAVLKHRINLFLYRRTDILKEKWKDLSTRKKLFRGSIIGIGIFFYLVYLVLLKGFNSVFLSINAFSTLGFGKIPVHGLSRYVAIIEGFTGWFLLSVFSISLIG